MHWSEVVGLAQRWPEVVEGVSYGEPSLKVRKRLLTRYRLGDDSIVLLDVPFDEREHLIKLRTEAFFCEPHYQNHDIILARLKHVPAEIVEQLLERRWRNSATKRAVAAFDS